MKNSKKTKIEISNSAEQCVIDIEGTIGVPEQSQFDAADTRVTTYERLREAIERISEVSAPKVVVNIRSTGGDVNDAMLIYEALAALPAQIVTRCYGYTASAATIIAQAADEGCREIAASALYLVHNSVCAAEGNAAELASRVDLLQKTDERIAGLYAARSGRSAEEFSALMAENGGEGRWLSPEEAVEAGLADRIITPDRQAKSQGGVIDRVKRLFGFAAEEDTAVEDTLRGGLPSDVNILHLPSPAEPGQGSQILFDEGQQSVGPTRTAPLEDPFDQGARTTHNTEAYSADARNFRARIL